MRIRHILKLYMFVCFYICVDLSESFLRRFRDRKIIFQKGSVAHSSKCHLSNEEGISTLSGKPLKLTNQFTFLGSIISATESKINIRIGKKWTTLDDFSRIYMHHLDSDVKLEEEDGSFTSVVSW